jgi:hypothetical protein
MKNDTKVRGHFTVQHLDKNGKLKGEYDMPNGIVDVGMNHMLETEFNGGTPITTWYCALIDNSGFSTLAAGTASFASAVSAVSGDTLKITYTVSG